MINRMASRRGALAAFGGASLVLLGCATAAAKAETYLIFFDAQAAVVIPSAKPIVDAIKGAIKPNSRVTIVGHSDTSEKEPDKLALARATAVQKAIAAAIGNSRAVFTVSSAGATNLLKPTGPNEPEGLNRVVVVTVE